MKNRVVEINGNVAAIEIQYKNTTLLCYINRTDLSKAASIKGTWHISRSKSGHIDGVKTKIQINKVRKQIWLHNFIFSKLNPNNVVDHIDHNTLNNVSTNLREVSRGQNAQNISTTLKSSTAYRNVTIDGGKYRVRIGGHSFGRYNTLEEAVAVAKKERKHIFPLSSEIDNRITL